MNSCKGSMCWVIEIFNHLRHRISNNHEGSLIIILINNLIKLINTLIFVIILIGT